jgi:glycosyltransferase involved in cell wall biosynthesis
MARILVALHQLELGGSQLNGLDLAAAMRDRGHDVTLFAPVHGEPGPVAGLARDAGLDLELADEARRVPARLAPVRRPVARRLADVVSARRIELVHAYEYPLGLDAFYGPHLRLGTPLAYTIYGMDVPRWLPRYPPMVVGTRELSDRTAAFRDRPAVLIEPPVNTEVDDPAAVDAEAFRAEHDIAGDDTLLVVVSRLEPEMKAEAIERAMWAVRALAGETGRLRLVVAGDGPSYRPLAATARTVNAALGYPAVTLTGMLKDPRPAYAAADIALGMGGSALRAMAFGKPLVVLGTRGFARPFTPATAEGFFRAGFYGVGPLNGDGAGATDPHGLAGHLRRLLAAAPLERRALGTLCRDVVLERYSLRAAAARLEAVYADALAIRPPRRRRIAEAARTLAYRTGSELVPERAKTRIRRVLR